MPDWLFLQPPCDRICSVLGDGFPRRRRWDGSIFDLYHASRDRGDTFVDQERVIAALREEQAAIRQAVQRLTARLGARSNGPASPRPSPTPGGGDRACLSGAALPQSNGRPGHIDWGWSG